MLMRIFWTFFLAIFLCLHVTASTGAGPYTCATIANSTGQGVGDTCVCNYGFEWVPGFCLIDCRFDPNSIGSRNSTTSCACKTGFVWSGVQCIASGPAVNCGSITYSTGQTNGMGGCLCVSGFLWRDNACWRDCSLLPNTAGQFGPDISSCTCNSPFVWNSVACSTSAINCNLIPFAQGPGLNLGSCNCISGYAWNGTNCTSSINCALLPNTVPTPGGVFNGTCTCNTGFIWRSDSVACFRVCSGIANSDGTNNGPTACNCIPGFVWNSTSNICTRSSVNCGSVPYATGTSPTDPTVCLCQPRYYWTSNNQSCSIDCASIPNSLGRSLYPGTCDCLSGYTWTNNICQANCASIPFTNGVNMTTGNCNCFTNFVWANGICSIDCRRIANSLGTSRSTSQCNCMSGYTWTAATYSCKKNQGLSPGAKLALGLALGLGLPLLLLLLAGLAYWCCGCNFCGCGGYGCCPCCAPMGGSMIQTMDGPMVTGDRFIVEQVNTVPTVQTLVPTQTTNLIPVMAQPQASVMVPQMASTFMPSSSVMGPALMRNSIQTVGQFVQAPVMSNMYGGMVMNGVSRNSGLIIPGINTGSRTII